MKNHLKYLKYLIAAIITIALAQLVERNVLLPEDQEIDTEKFVHILLNKEKELSLTLDSILQKSRPFVGNKGENLFEHLNEIEFNLFKDKGYIVLVYLDDSLRFWSDNSIQVNTNLENSEVNNTLVNLNNAWYYVKNLHEKNLDVFGLILLKYTYPFENEYLRNEYQSDFDLPASIQISKVPLSYSFDLKDAGNNYLFSLVAANTIYLENKNWKSIGMIYFLGIAFFFLFLDKLLKLIVLNRNKAEWIVLAVLSGIFVARFLMLEFKIPHQLYSMPYFGPGYFTGSYLFPSAGDFYLNAILILFFTRSFFYLLRPGKIGRRTNKKPKCIKYLIGIPGILILLLYYHFIICLLNDLALNSSIALDAFNITELDLLSLLAFLVFALLLSSLVLAANYLLKIVRQIFKIKEFVLITTILILIYFALILHQKWELAAFSPIYLVILILVLTYQQARWQKPNFFIYVILIALGSIYLSLLINKTGKEKETNKSNILISSLLNDRDKIAEHMFISLFENLESDKQLKEYLTDFNGNSQEKIKKILINNYFGDYFDRYTIEIEICCLCKDNDRLKLIHDCEASYNKIIKEYGKPIENTVFYYLDHYQGQSSYLGFLNYDGGDTPDKYRIYILINPKSAVNEKGYPDLLIEGDSYKTSLLRKYSFAKYLDGRLVLKSGSYPYDLSDKMFRTGKDGMLNLSENEFEHTLFHENNILLVLTRPRVKGFDLLISFSYIFVFLNFLLVISLSISNFNLIRKKLLTTFENKLLLTMLLILAISFAMVTAGTVYYNTRQFEKKHFSNISEKIESVQKHLELELNKTSFEDSLKHEPGRQELAFVLKGLADIYNTDINCFDYSGKLVATSREEIFKLGLLGTFMHPIAYKQMRIDEKMRYIHNENIGKLHYSSAYAVFSTRNFKNPFYINLPYFTKPGELRKETTNLIVAIINLYVVLFILAAMVSFVMANKITQPLRMLQHKFKQIELGKESEMIFYNRKDEIGALVAEYNRMVLKLAESIEQLARTERETAWREMAKQIAHEIKNPLTPMKLSVQFLQRSWQDKDSSFEKKLQKCTQTLIDQINTLSNIASEFSTFAKMPKPKREVVNLVVTIENIITLFSNTENLKLTSNIDHFTQLLIISDHEHISRALTNLVKNGIQAIPFEKEGLIDISLEDQGNKVQVRISDNGSGISEQQKDKLFIPNFTTKSSGMGMGLPIVKDIIEAAKGKIWFETIFGTGTTFIVELPLAADTEISEIQSNYS